MLVYDIIPIRNEKVKKAAVATTLALAGVALAAGFVSFFALNRLQTEASAGQVIVLWSGASVPSGWTCISCAVTDPFFGAFPMGSSTYANATSGSDTAAPTATFVSETTGGSVSISRTGSTYSSASHTHTVTGTSVAAADIRPPYQDLELIEAATTTLPNGAIGIFDVSSSSLPANWSYYSAMAGRYLRAAGDTATGGAATSTNLLTATAAADTGTGVGAQQNGGTLVSAALLGHTHSISGNILPASDTPPYVSVVFGQLTATSTIPAGLIAMFDAAPPAGWDSVSNATGTFNGRFLRGSDAYGATGGFATVVHATTTITSAAPTSTQVQSTRSGTTAVADGAHTHNFTFSFGAESIVPVNRQVIFAKREPNVTVGTAGTEVSSTTFPVSGLYIGGAFTFVRDSGAATATQIMVTETGTINANANLSNLVLYYQATTTCATSSIPGSAAQFNAAGVGFNASDQATATGTMPVGTSQVCVYARVDVGSGASAGNTINFEIADPATDVAMSAGTVSPATAVAIAGTTTLNGPTLTVGTTGSQIATTTIPKSSFYVGGAFTFSGNAGTSTVTQIMISETGSVNANANLSNVKLFYEQTATCATSTIPGGVTAFNSTGGTFNSSEQSTVTGSMPVGTAQVCVYVQLDIGSGANASDTVDIQITDPATDVTASGAAVAPATAVAIAGTTTLEAPSSFLIEHDFRVYENVDAVNPVTPLAAEDASATGIAQSGVIRLRLNIISSNGPLATSSQAFKLQYAAKSGFSSCTSVPGGNFADVGAFGSSTIWRGFNNTSTADGTVVTSTLLTTSTVGESYVEENPSPANPNRISTNGVGEWDFVVENNGATSDAEYCFRAVKSDGTSLAQYDALPDVQVVRGLFEAHYRWRNDDGGQ